MRFIGFTVIFLSLILPCRYADSQVCINEYLSLNINGIMDEDHEYTDWIEIYNNSDLPANISGYGLTDDPEIPLKWTLPVAVLPARNHLLIYASGKNRKQLPMNFETIIDAGDEWKFMVPASDIGNSWLNPEYDDSSWQSGSSGFGYADNDDSTVIATSSLSVFIRKEFDIFSIGEISRLILSIDYDDGFVAYINGQEVARSNLGNWGEYMAWNRLATSSHEATMYFGGNPEYFEILNLSEILVEGTNVVAIQVHNNAATSSDLSLTPFLTVGKLEGGINKVSKWLSFPTYGRLHTNFRMDADSEAVYLFNPQGLLIDSTANINMLRDVSYGRLGDGSATWKFIGIPTPGAENTSVCSGTVIADSVIFSPEGGLYPGGVTVGLISPGGAGDSIFYTLDGSVPDRTDELYSAPVTLSSAKVIRARVIRSDKLPGPVCSHTYITGLDHELPVVSLTTEPFNLWDNLAGIYVFGPHPPTEMPYYEANYWKDWERPVHIELYDVNGIRQINQDGGMKIFGGWSRTNPQKSFSLFARKQYGKGSFQYRFFNTRSHIKFESLVLRNSGNDNMGLQFHDCFMTGLARDMDVDVQAYQPAAVYLNGEYWGLLNIREKVSENFVAENHLIDADSVNLLEYDGQVINGSNTQYLQLRDFMNQKSTLRNSADFNWVNEKMNMDNFIQYQLLNIYLNNRDWPGNNIKFWNTTAAGSKWRWISFDTDFGFGIWDVNDYQMNTLDFALDPAGPDWPNPPWSTLFLRRLVSNPDFRNNFINQFCDRLNQDFHPLRVIADIDSLKALYNHEIIQCFNRWDASYDDWLCKYDAWLYRIENRKVFGQNRPAYCRQYLQSVFQLGSQQNVTINVSDKNAGTIRLNSILVKSYPFSGIYFRNVPIKMTAIPKPGYKFTGWEGTINSTTPEITYNMASGGSFKANFTQASEQDVSIIINEINYNSSINYNTKDWIELHNNGLTTVDLSGWILCDAYIDSGYVFPSGTIMIPGSYLVICRNIEDFRGHNPNVRNSIGEIDFGLSSQGDIVRLFDDKNTLIDAVNFGTIFPWPEDANGTGKTLELKDPILDNSIPENWLAIVRGGTPGLINSSDTTSTQVPELQSESIFESFPNPFSDFTTIRFNISNHGKYALEVLDMQGRVVMVLHEGELKPDTYWIDWNGEGILSGGVFTIRLTGAGEIRTMKVVKL